MLESLYKFLVFSPNLLNFYLTLPFKITILVDQTTVNSQMSMIEIIWISPYIVLDAKFVSSCFNCPSNAKPRLFLLLFNNGLTLNTLDNVKPGPTGLSLSKLWWLINLVFIFGNQGFFKDFQGSFPRFLIHQKIICWFLGKNPFFRWVNLQWKCCGR